MAEFVVTAMVLSASNVGEQDRRVTLLTKERGKISAFMKGARRQGSALAAAANPMCFGTFYGYDSGRNMYIQKVDITCFYEGIIGNYDKTCLASYFLEMAEYLSVEEGDEAGRLLLTYMALKAVEAGMVEPELLKVIYELRTLVVDGEQPELFRCVGCGTSRTARTSQSPAVTALLEGEPGAYFSLVGRGVTCASCAQKMAAVPLSPAALYALRFIETAPVNKLFSFRLTDEVKSEVIMLLNNYRRNYSNHLYKSEQFL